MSGEFSSLQDLIENMKKRKISELKLVLRIKRGFAYREKDNVFLNKIQSDLITCWVFWLKAPPTGEDNAANQGITSVLPLSKALRCVCVRVYYRV